MCTYLQKAVKSCWTVDELLEMQLLVYAILQSNTAKNDSSWGLHYNASGLYLYMKYYKAT